MKRSLLIALSLVLFATTAFSQAGSIMLFSDLGFTNCDLYDVPGIVSSVYVVQMFTPGAVSAQFKVDHSSWGAFLLWLSDTTPYLAIGNSEIGIEIMYFMCRPSPNLILSIQYFGQGLSLPCSYIQVVPHPVVPSGQIEVGDCGGGVLIVTGGDLVVNPDPSCMCNIPVEETTWGKVKALYQ